MGTPGDPKADMLPVRFQVRAPGRKFRGDGVGGDRMVLLATASLRLTRCVAHSRRSVSGPERCRALSLLQPFLPPPFPGPPRAWGRRLARGSRPRAPFPWEAGAARAARGRVCLGEGGLRAESTGTETLPRGASGFTDSSRGRPCRPPRRLLSVRIDEGSPVRNERHGVSLRAALGRIRGAPGCTCRSRPGTGARPVVFLRMSLPIRVSVPNGPSYPALLAHSSWGQRSGEGQRRSGGCPRVVTATASPSVTIGPLSSSAETPLCAQPPEGRVARRVRRRGAGGRGWPAFWEPRAAGPGTAL